MENHNNLPTVRIYQSSVTWNICNYFQPLNEKDTVIESHEFVTELRDQIKWKLAIIISRFHDTLYVSKCILRRSASCCGPKHIVVKVKISLMDSKDILWLRVIREECFYPDTAITFKSSDECESFPIPYADVIDIFGNVRVFCDILQDFPLIFLPSDVDEDMWNLSNDLKIFYRIGNLTDLDLMSNGETFSVHSAIVKARSPYVADKLKKSKRGIRKLCLPGNCPIPLLKGLILYWYSGDLEKIPRKLYPSISTGIRLMKHDELEPYTEPERLEMSTNCKTSNKSISWVIEDYQFCEYLRHLEGNIFPIYKCEDLPWKLLFYPKGTTNNTYFISLSITNENKINDCKEGYVEVFFKGENGIEYGSKHIILRYSTFGIYEFPRFMRHDKFFRLRETLLKRNILEIGCRMFFGPENMIYDTDTGPDYKAVPYSKEHPYTILADNLKNLLQSADSSDLSLISRGRIFRVHSAILAARSRYFNELLPNREQEIPQPDEIVMEDIEPDDLDMILKYVYYAKKIVLNSELALRLYPVFRKYKITRLDDLCSNYLRNNLSVENVLDIAKLADTFHDEPLKEAVKKFLH